MNRRILSVILSALMSVSVLQTPIIAQEGESPADEPEATEITENEQPEGAGDQTALPEESEEPEVTAGESEETKEPEVTEAPEGTEEPEVTEAPEGTEEPEATEAPEGTEEPEATESPEGTEEPEATESPEGTEEPEATEEPAEEEIIIVEQSGEYDGVTVSVSYSSDTFEKEVTLVVAEAGETETAALDAAFDGDYKAVDISFIDEEGNKLQPLEGKSVDVSLSANDMVAGTVQAMHVDAEGNIDFIGDNQLSVSNGEITTAEVEVLIPEVVEVPVYEEVTNEIDVPAVLGIRTVDITEEVTVPAEIGTRTVDVTEEVTVPAEMGTRTVEKTREVEVPAVIGYRTVRKTREVETKKSLLSILFPSLFKKTKIEYYYEKEPYVIKEAYTKTETYTEEEEYVVTPEHTETRVVGTREEEYVITPEHTETRVVGTREEEYVVTPGYTTTETVQVQTGTEWQETGEMVTETRTVNVNDIEVQFAATQFSTYAIRTDAITSGQEYVIYTNANYAFAHNLSREAISRSGNPEIVTSDSDNIKWLFESVTGGYKISYMNNGVKTYLRAVPAEYYGYIYDYDGLNTTTNANDDGTTWSVTNSFRISVSTDSGAVYYLKYRGNNWRLETGSSDVRLAQQQGGSGPSGGVNVHYVDADGNVIKTFTVDGETQDYCDISETISVATSTTDHFNTYTATSGTIYDLVFEIEGHTYNSTYLTSYTSATSHGDRINAEAFRYSNGSWGYTNYGGDASTSANDHSEDIHSFGTITDVYVVYDKKTTNPDDPSGGGDDEELDAPTTGKTVEDNDDGTSTLSLSIAGSSKDISKNIGANVIVIFDRSGSMNATRLTEAKTAARTVATELLGLNGTTPGDDPLVEMLLIAFGGSASPSATETGTWYSIAGPNNDQQTTTGFNGAVNAIGNQQGTNWEIALQSALAQAQSHLAVEAQRSGRSDPDSPDYERVDDTYIIFITDGQPSMKVGDTRYHTESTTATFYTQSNYVRATDEARSIVEAGYNLYSIGIYGTIEVLHYLTDFALTGRSTYDSSKSGSNNANGHYFTASNYSALATALSTIADTITGKLAVAGVSFTDGIATSVTSTNISGGNASGFKYTVKNGSGALIYEVAIDNSNNATFKFGPGSDYNGETFTVASNASGTAGTGSNGTAYTATAESVTTSFDWTSPDGTQTGTKTSTNMVYTVKIGDTEYKMSPASVDANGEVQWDLAGVGTIDSGYVWTVSFIVWPDQDAYDIVTDLNNGIETDYKWIDFDSSLDPSTECAREQRDTNGNLLYYYDGVFVKNDSGEWVKSQYTHIVKYPGTSTYAALTNTHQDVQYFIYDEDTGTYIGPVNHEIAPPDPISLDAALATVQKKWEVDLDKEQLIYALFNTWTGESNELKVEMHVFEDHEGDDYDFADQYTQTTLGWQSDISAYDWADDPEDIEQIELYGRTYTIGTLWEDDLSIAVGVMIDEDKAEEYGLTDNAYAVINGKKYYVLEHGHDYDIVESGFQNYRFDYISHTYHPMLVDGDMYDLQNLRIGGTDEDGKQYYVFDSVEPMTALVAHNTLRGGINISKSVIDGDEEPYDTDTNFTFEITLDNPTEDVFVDDSIPWYAVTNGKTYNDGSPIYFYYHDADGNLYQASGVEHDGEIATFTLYDEEGNAYPATSTEFAEKAGPADITYTKDGEEITIALYGNALTVSDGNKKASATLTIPATDVIRIANVPYKTTYTINEVDVTGFDLVEIKQTIQPSEDAPASQKTITTLTNDVVEDVEIEAMKVRADSKLIGIVDEIVPNNQNNIGFTNQTTSEAFYVYHSSDNKVEKILFADTRVNNEYANDQIVYQFNIANETKAGSLYGGYYQSYAGAVATDDQITGKAAEGKLVYAEGTSETMYDGTHTGGMWADDAEGAKSYDYAYVKAVKAGTEDGWDSDYYTAKGTEMSPEKDTVYYLKEVPDHYDLPYTHYTYNKGDKLLRNMWYITATDDLKYGEVGFVIKLTNENGDVATIVDTLTVQNATGGTTVKLTPKSIFGGNATTKPVQGGYLGYTDETSRIEANTTSVFTPYWKTMDGVTVRGLTTRTINFNNGKVGTGGMLITNADTAAALLLADINTGN